ncbi:MAG: penicillin-binding protein 2 [Prosthecobacter sp.]|nr:penicillin-binding protein 2 [Prosthecobacter sp.]
MKPPPPSHHQLRIDRPVVKRMLLAACGLTVGFSFVAWRLYDLHLKRGPMLAEQAAQKFSEVRALPAQRGSIKDFGGRYLAYDEETFHLRTNRVHLHELLTARLAISEMREAGLPFPPTTGLSKEEIIALYQEHIATHIAPKLGLSHSEVLEKLRSPQQIVMLAERLTEDQAREWKELLAAQHIRGVYVGSTIRRRYPTENRLALIVGSVEDGKGAGGIEKTQDTVLRGTPGRVEVEHDKSGRELPLYRGEIREPVHGRDIHLTIDMALQDAVDQIIERADLEWRPHKIMAVVTDVHDGSVLAMSFRPGHDRLAQKPSETNWKNLCICEPYEPGSTFKIVTFTGALDTGKISPTTPVDCAFGTYQDPVLKGKPLTDLKKMGVVPAADVFKHSSNVGTYKISKRLGQGPFLEYAKRFGFGTQTLIPLTGESAGRYNSEARNWSNDTHTRLPIGYEVSVTPLQMAMAYGAIANGGILMRPRLIDRIVSDGGRKVEIMPAQSVGQVCKGQTAATMRSLLELVVEEGTGTRASISGLKVAGKTGTTRRYDPNYRYRDAEGRWHKGGYPPRQWIASFAGYAPAENPKIACVVVLDYPKTEADDAVGGGKMAAPIFGEIAAEVLKQLSVRPNRPLALEGGGQE